MELIFSLALSLHVGLEGNYNEFHPHVGLEYNNYLAGVYYNSEENASFYFGRDHEITDKLSIETGVVTGYTDEPLLPYIRAKYDNFFIAPAYEYGEIAGFVTGYEFKF